MRDLIIFILAMGWSEFGFFLFCFALFAVQDIGRHMCGAAIAAAKEFSRTMRGAMALNQD